MYTEREQQGGFTIIEVLIAMFVIGTVVTGLFGLFILSIRTSQEAERRIVAIALANERMEMIRNLPYAKVGTSGGVPSGSISQSETIARNGVDYLVRTDIRYVDDLYDGGVDGSSSEEEKITICHKAGSSNEQTLEVPASALDAHLGHGDTTGACGGGGGSTGPGDAYNADYKQARVEVTWNSQYDIAPILLISLIAPSGIEGGEDGGTLDFQALNSLGEGVPQAQVTIVNDTVSPAISITTETNSEGRVVLPGMPPGSGYALSVTKEGYSSEQTYDTTSTFIPDADHAHLTMLLGEITAKTFFIDELGSISLHVTDEDSLDVAGLPFELHGTKTIGVDDTGEPVYVVVETGPTDVSGQAIFSELPWDSYSFALNGSVDGYDIKEASLLLPVAIEPGAVESLDVSVVPYTPVSLQVSVLNDASEFVDNASVHVSGNGFDETLGTGVQGQVYFGDLPISGADYDISIDAPGYATYVDVVQVEGTVAITLILNLPS